MTSTYSDILNSLPEHLRQYIVDQDYSRYTPVDQATWRFSLRQLKAFLSTHAYECYLEGLEKTGITVNEIPKVDAICEKLKKFGWFALPVSGFIPPAAFMELQSLNILPIASDMRSVDHILYTPAPDIVHEAAGHAPMLVDPDFAQYLKNYSQVAKKAIISHEDLAQYEAIRNLSDIKEDPHSTPEQVTQAERALAAITSSMTHVSEAALLGRMNWWTAEYGLIGDLENPKIFGAGLLSSVGEARNALSPNVKKVKLSMNCIDTSYDITEQQPQLFVVKTFNELSHVLEAMESRLSFRIGGAHGLEQAKKAKTVNTIMLNSGIQISGKLIEYSQSEDLKPYFVRFEGPCQVSFQDKELPGHSKSHHSTGYSTPIGILQNQSICLSEMNLAQLKELNIIENTKCRLLFQSRVSVQGHLKKITRIENRPVLLSFTDCTVKTISPSGVDEILFKPEWGDYDMAVGSQVVSVSGGPADRSAYGLIDSFVQKIIPRRDTSAHEKLVHSFYNTVRDIRCGLKNVDSSFIEQFLVQLKNEAPYEWLLFVETLELTYIFPELSDSAQKCKAELLRIQKTKPEKSQYIELGLTLAQTIL